ncbi:MAG: VCBS repeat-containing protein, partial [Calditrichaeota bacterium]|nr:VCBS repeat-containing protein [Calditrichota bacterium]
MNGLTSSKPVIAWGGVRDDWNSGPLDMGWTFVFYGEEFNSIRICSNGFASFTSTSTAYQPFPVPSEAEPYNLLAPQWVDLDPSRGGTIYFYTNADEEVTIISWINIPGYGGGTRQTFQLILSGDGSIKYQYADENPAGRNTCIGIQNGDGTDGLSIHWGNEEGGPIGRAYSIMRSWVRLNPIAEEIDPNDRLDVTMILDATNLIEGLYEADVDIISNDIENPRVTVNVKLMVGEGPGIDVQPESIEFGDILIGDADHQTITLTNISMVDLEIERITIDGDGFSHNHTGGDNFILSPEETRSLIVNFNPDNAQNYNSELTVFSDDAAQPEVAIQLTGQGIAQPPDIYLSYLPDEDPGIYFTEHTISENFDGADDICLVDLDDDGDMDVLGAAAIADDIVWWENDGSENFTRNMVSGNFDGAVSICWKDLDRDGDIDILGAAQDADDITWWENDGNESFTAHTIAGDFDGATSVFTIDLDSDGDIDVLGAAFDADDIIWWENDGHQDFTEHTIEGDFDGASSISAIDLDGDGDIDVLGTANEADDITWWEKNGQNSFSDHTIEGDLDGACSVY